jgi:hypothetical protein
MSTSSTTAGMIFWVLIMLWILPRRASGTGTMPTLGSIVQNG